AGLLKRCAINLEPRMRPSSEAVKLPLARCGNNACASPVMLMGYRMQVRSSVTRVTRNATSVSCHMKVILDQSHRGEQQVNDLDADERSDNAANSIDQQ